MRLIHSRGLLAFRLDGWVRGVIRGRVRLYSLSSVRNKRSFQETLGTGRAESGDWIS